MLRFREDDNLKETNAQTLSRVKQPARTAAAIPDRPHCMARAWGNCVPAEAGRKWLELPGKNCSVVLKATALYSWQLPPIGLPAEKPEFVEDSAIP